MASPLFPTNDDHRIIQKRDDYRDVADPVQQKTVAFPYSRDDHPGNRRADQSGAFTIEEFSAIAFPRSSRASHHLDDKRLSRRHIKGVNEALGEGQTGYVPDRDDSRQCEDGERARLQHREDLRDDEGPVPIPAIDQHTRERAQEERGHLAAKLTVPKKDGGTRQTVYQPPGSDAGHPGADEGYALATEEQPVIAGTQGADYKRPTGHLHWTHLPRFVWRQSVRPRRRFFKSVLVRQ